MKMSEHIQALQADLQDAAALGGEGVAEAATRLTRALKAAVSVRLLETLGEVALELNEQLPAGHVELRVAGQDPELVFVEEEAPTSSAAPDEELSARITLRLPETLKASVEAAAAREGVSLNTYVVRVLAGRVDSRGGARSRSNRLRGFARG